MIYKLWLKNYGPFRSSTIKLRPLTVVVGPNASGKSMTLDAASRLLRAEDDENALPIQELGAEMLAALRKRGSESAPVEIGIETGHERGISWRLLPSGKFKRKRWTEEGPEPLPIAVPIRLEPQALRQASYIDSDEPLLKEDGYGLATVLADMKLSDSEGFTSILSRTRAIVPTFEDLRFKRVKVRDDIYGYELIFDMKNAAGLPPSAASDGTLLTLGLLTILTGYSKRRIDDQRPLLFLIDELEHSLHPRALGELVAQLRRLTEKRNVQVLATSHSPYLVDWLRPEEVRITGLLEDGSATIRELGDHPEFDRWKEEMSPGEFWSTVGEDWIK